MWLLHGSWRKGYNIAAKLYMPYPVPPLTSASAKWKTEAQGHHPLSEHPELFSAGTEIQSMPLAFLLKAFQWGGLEAGPSPSIPPRQHHCSSQET